MLTSIKFRKTKQATPSYAGYNKNIDTSYMAVSEPMYDNVHAKYLRNLTKKQKRKSSKLQAEMRK